MKPEIYFDTKEKRLKARIEAGTNFEKNLNAVMGMFEI